MTAKSSSARTLPQKDYLARNRRYQMLAAWYGAERAETEITAHTCRPELISGVLDDVLSQVRNQSAGVVVTLRSQWSNVIGATFAGFCEPEDFRDGVLYIKVRHSALIAELSPMSDIFIAAVNKLLTAPSQCKAVRFV